MEKLYVREVTSKYRKLQTKVNVMSVPSAVWQFLRRKIGNNCQEHFVVLGIDNKNTLVMYQPVSVGTVTESIVHPREVFHLAVRELCSGLLYVTITHQVIQHHLKRYRNNTQVN
jgi:DNA repair protein RadC